MDSGTFLDRLTEVVRNDARYPVEAYQYVFEALDYTVRNKYAVDDDSKTSNRHVTGQDLLAGIRDYAVETFGCLAVTVLESWGIQSSEDFGEIVFNLVDHGLMGQQDSDSRDDFAGGFRGQSLSSAFDVEASLEYCHERGEWTASYRSVAHD